MCSFPRLARTLLALATLCCVKAHAEDARLNLAGLAAVLAEGSDHDAARRPASEALDRDANDTQALEASMARKLDETQPWLFRIWPTALKVGGIWALGIILLLVIGSLLSALTTPAAPKLPEQLDGQYDAVSSLSLPLLSLSIVGASAMTAIRPTRPDGVGQGSR